MFEKTLDSHEKVSVNSFLHGYGSVADELHALANKEGHTLRRKMIQTCSCSSFGALMSYAASENAFIIFRKGWLFAASDFIFSFT